MKPIGIGLSVAALLGAIGAMMLIARPRQPGRSLGSLLALVSHIGAASMGAAAFALLACIAWAVVQPSWVRAAGDQYARALLAYCDKTAGPSSESSKVLYEYR